MVQPQVQAIGHDDGFERVADDQSEKLAGFEPAFAVGRVLRGEIEEDFHGWGVPIKNAGLTTAESTVMAFRIFQQFVCLLAPCSRRRAETSESASRQPFELIRAIRSEMG
ncbi:MAG TPA: hypothetical protein VNN72_12340, partial [Polyangiaceae bacterium]|nr:hypothetical protein [Polyangiaceae bacterium]